MLSAESWLVCHRKRSQIYFAAWYRCSLESGNPSRLILGAFSSLWQGGLTSCTAHQHDHRARTHTHTPTHTHTHAQAHTHGEEAILLVLADALEDEGPVRRLEQPRPWRGGGGSLLWVMDTTTQHQRMQITMGKWGLLWAVEICWGDFRRTEPIFGPQHQAVAFENVL